MTEVDQAVSAGDRVTPCWNRNGRRCPPGDRATRRNRRSVGRHVGACFPHPTFRAVAQPPPTSSCFSDPSVASRVAYSRKIRQVSRSNNPSQAAYALNYRCHNIVSHCPVSHSPIILQDVVYDSTARHQASSVTITTLYHCVWLCCMPCFLKYFATTAYCPLLCHARTTQRGCQNY
jgi:hypothetical protein